MPDRPIIFSGPMVRALLDGRKTMTRRIIKPRPWSKKDGDTVCIGIAASARYTQGADSRFYYAFEHPKGGPLTAYVARHAVGDRLWVREAWAMPHGFDLASASISIRDLLASKGKVPVYRATDNPNSYAWRPSIHMPRWASRLTLTVTEVKVERLQDISEDDAEAEGLARGHAGGPWGEEGLIEDFADLWNSLHGPGAWDANPWVAAIRFTVAKGNIDA